MPYGYTGKTLRVNLTDGTISVEEHDERFYRRYFGGRNFIAYTLLKELEPGVDPLGPENKLIFATGVITGTPVAGAGRHSVGAKSPLTGGYGEAEVGGYWGSELKRAGFDAIIVEGQAAEPVYLWVHDGEAEIRPANHLWGKHVGEAEDAIRDELQEPRLHTALIGQAGENRVRMANIIHDRSRSAGRCGLGAVMGSKRLKGIAVRGRGRLEVADKAELAAISRYVMEVKDQWEGFTDTGTAGSVVVLSAAGGLPTHNFQAGSFPEAEQINGDVMRDTILVDRPTCYACPIHCKRDVAVSNGEWTVEAGYGGPEYETMAALGSNSGVGNLKAVAKANELCSKYGLDTIGTGNVIGFTMECFQCGLLTPEMTGGWKIEFGDAAGIVEAVDMIAHRRGFGDRMAEGVKRLAEFIGPEAEPSALHVKGQELPMHEPRIKHGTGFGYAVSPTGADHVHNIHDTAYTTEGGWFPARALSLGILEPLPFDDLSARKVRLFIYDVNWWSLDNCLVLCANLVVAYDHTHRTRIVRAATGWNSTAVELFKVGERSVTLTRAFNVREGFTRADDRIPARFFSSLAGSPKSVPLRKDEFDQALTTYYRMMGWDDNGVPTRWKLAELDIEWVADELARYGKAAAE